MVVASLTSFVGDHGVYAVFGLMAAAAVVPAASELVMVYAGALASGAVSGHVVLFGDRIHSHAWAYVTLALAGALGNTVGAGIGWAIGIYGGRPLLERHGRLLHVTPKRMERAEAWFERFGVVAVPLGFAAPVVRSFVAIPAGLFRERLPQFLPLAALGCTAFCFGLAAGGYALGSSYNSLHDVLQYVGIALVVCVALAVGVLWYRKRSSNMARRAEDSAR